jgi:hypothetical protein
MIDFVSSSMKPAPQKELPRPSARLPTDDTHHHRCRDDQISASAAA